MGKGIGGHTKPHEGVSDEWLTPPHIINALGPFDLDPCAAPEPRPWPTARRHYTKADVSGLMLPWEGRVWLNPPYGKETARWLAKLAEHGTGTALIFARTETEFFFEHVWAKADAVLFVRGRLHFHLPDGTRAPHNSGGPSVLVAYGKADAEALRDSGLDGHFIYARREA